MRSEQRQPALRSLAVSRLAQQHADLHRVLTAGSEAEQRAAVERLVAAAVEATGLSRADVREAGAAQRLDERAWDMQEQVKCGNVRQDEYEAAFRRARAASAVQTLADPRADLADAAYEAVHALPPHIDGVSIIGG